MSVQYNISSKDVFRQGIIKALKQRPMTYQELYSYLCKNGLCNTSLYWYLDRLKEMGLIVSNKRISGTVGRPQIEYRSSGHS